MKEVRVEVPQNQIEIIDDYLKLTKIKVSTMDTLEGNRLYVMDVEEQDTNNLVHELKARGVGQAFGKISIVPYSLYLNSSSTTTTVEKSVAANLEEILANIEDTAVLSSTYVTLILLSGALAALGLYNNSVVIIIGSMIVAPLMGPIALTSIGVLLPKRNLFRKGLLAELFGLLLTIGISFIIGLMIGEPSTLPHEMVIRAEPGPQDIAFAIISAIAAGVIISKGQSLSIVGVAIAASLAPPAANIGLFLSFGDFTSAGFAAALLIMNVLAINASCSIIFILFKLPEKAGISKRRASRAQKMSQRLTTGVILVFIAISIYILLNQQKP